MCIHVEFFAHPAQGIEHLRLPNLVYSIFELLMQVILVVIFEPVLDALGHFQAKWQASSVKIFAFGPKRVGIFERRPVSIFAGATDVFQKTIFPDLDRREKLPQKLMNWAEIVVTEHISE